MHITARDRLGAATGAAFVALLLVGNALSIAGTGPSSHPTGEQVLKDTAHQASSTGATVGIVLEFVGLAAFIAFLGFLADVLLRRTGEGQPGMSGRVAVVAGIATLAVKLGGAAPFLTLLLDRRQLSPQLALILNDMNGAAFVLSWLPFAVFVGAAATALRQTGLVGRPTAYVGHVLGIAGLALALVGVTDPINATPVAFLLGLVWLLVVSVRLGVKPTIEAPVDRVRPRSVVPVGA